MRHPTGMGCAHAMYRGKLYNGHDASTITEWGASVCGIEQVKSLTGRGVLLDIAKLHGVDVLEPGHAIGFEDLTAAAEAQGVEIRTGDIILVRTGLFAYAKAGDLDSYYGEPIPELGIVRSAGIGVTACEWFYDHNIAAVATDNIVFEVLPFDPAFEGAIIAIHCLDLVDMGLTQGQNWDLEGTGRRLRGRRPVRLLPGGLAPAVRRRTGITGQPGGHQVAAALRPPQEAFPGEQPPRRAPPRIGSPGAAGSGGRRERPECPRR